MSGLDQATDKTKLDAINTDIAEKVNAEIRNVQDPHDYAQMYNKVTADATKVEQNPAVMPQAQVEKDGISFIAQPGAALPTKGHTGCKETESQPVPTKS